MNLFKQTKGLVDRLVGARKRSVINKSRDLLDLMQKYTTIGEYHVGAEDGTPNGKKFVLTVYQGDDGVLHQALSSEATANLAPEYVRKYSEELGRFRDFHSKKTGRRYLVEEFLDTFTAEVKKSTSVKAIIQLISVSLLTRILRIRIALIFMAGMVCSMCKNSLT